MSYEEERLFLAGIQELDEFWMIRIREKVLGLLDRKASALSGDNGRGLSSPLEWARQNGHGRMGPSCNEGSDTASLLFAQRTQRAVSIAGSCWVECVSVAEEPKVHDVLVVVRKEDRWGVQENRAGEGHSSDLFLTKEIT